jgi:hypothetical protein
MLEYRLLNLVKHFYQGHIPSEQQICGLFQVTATESRALIRSITSKYQYELEAIMKDTLRMKLQQDAQINAPSDFRIALNSNFYKDEFNKILAIHPQYKPIEKDLQTNGTYIIRNAEYQFLCNHFQIVPTQNPYQP